MVYLFLGGGQGMWLIMTFWIIIVLMLYQTYKEGKNNNAVRTSYRQSKCSTCENFNYAIRKCYLGEIPTKCYRWTHSDDDYYLQDDDR